MKACYSLTSLATLASLLAITNPAQADTLAINPGMWKTTITTTSQSLGSRTRTEKNCLKEDQFDVKNLLHDAVETDDCEYQSNLLGEVLEYTFSCQAELGTVFGEGNITTDADTTSGAMTMQMEAEGMSLGLNVTVNGKRIGDC